MPANDCRIAHFLYSQLVLRMSLVYMQQVTKMAGGLDLTLSFHFQKALLFRQAKELFCGNSTNHSTQIHQQGVWQSFHEG